MSWEKIGLGLPWGLFCGGLFFFTAFLWYKGYVGFTEWLAINHHFTTKLNVFRKEILSETLFNALLYLSSIFTLLAFFLTLFFRKKLESRTDQVFSQLRQFFLYFLSFFPDFGKLLLKERLMLGFILLFNLLIRFYLALYFPLLVDEAFTYVYFIDKGFWVCALYYPGPNNHIFFSECAYMLHGLLSFFINDALSGRLISNIAFILLLLIFFPYLRSRFDLFTTLIATALLSVSSPLMMYGILARGYVLQSFFFLLAWLSLREWLTKGNPGNAASLYILSSTLAFYTIPTYLYAFAGLALAGLIFCFKEEKNLSKWLRIHLWIALWVFLFYFPVILLNGWQKLALNSWVQSLSLETFLLQFPSYLIKWVQFFFQTETWASLVALILLLIMLLILALNKSSLKQADHLLCLTTLLLPFLMIFFQRMLPFERVFTYLSLSLLLLILFSIEALPLKKILKQSMLLLLLLLLSLSFVKNFIKPYPKSLPLQLVEMAFVKNYSHFFINEDSYEVYFRYYFYRSGKKFEIRRDSLSADTEMLLLDAKKTMPGKDRMQQFELLRSTEELKIFGKKD